jgi:hypothetical protein
MTPHPFAEALRLLRDQPDREAQRFGFDIALAIMDKRDRGSVTHIRCLSEYASGVIKPLQGTDAARHSCGLHHGRQRTMGQAPRIATHCRPHRR